VAWVNRDGLYDEIRQDFLTWFAGHLDSRTDPPRAVRAAVDRAFLPYRRPRVHRVRTIVGRVAAKGRGVLRRGVRTFRR
jgi:hypothetical protein